MNSIQNYGNLSFMAGKNSSSIKRVIKNLPDNGLAYQAKINELDETISNMELEILQNELRMFDTYQNGLPPIPSKRYNKLTKRLGYVYNEYNKLEELMK